MSVASPKSSVVILCGLALAAPVLAQAVKSGHVDLEVRASYPAVYLGAPLTPASAALLDSEYVRRTRPAKSSLGTGIQDNRYFYDEPRIWYPIGEHPALAGAVGRVPLYLVVGQTRMRWRIVAVRQEEYYELPRQLNRLIADSRSDPAAFEIPAWVRVFTPVVLAAGDRTGIGDGMEDWDPPEKWARKESILAGDLPLFPSVTIEGVGVDTFKYFTKFVAADGTPDSSGGVVWLDVIVRCRLAGQTLVLTYQAMAMFRADGELQFYPSWSYRSQCPGRFDHPFYRSSRDDEPSLRVGRRRDTPHVPAPYAC